MMINNVIHSVLKKLLSFFIVLFLCALPVRAQDMPNNPFGMHLASNSDQDFKDVANLVNSNGGDWGYVTFVIQDTDRDHGKWQGIFDNLRRLHLIPIVRIATHPDGAEWHKPTESDALAWSDFLNSLNWVVKDRYIILFNEPNHGQEWGGTTNAPDYAKIAKEFVRTLKERSPDFFIMLAGLDSAAPQAPGAYEDESIFLHQMIDTEPTLFDSIDGWASHSYPNPNFSGGPYSVGRNSIHNYEWELDLLKRLGISKNLPVFITETGWIHAEGIHYVSGLLNSDQLSEDFPILFSSLALDSRVRAITPFVLDYQGDPFSHFSWKKLNSPDFYSQYAAVQAMQKVKGEPPQITKVTVSATLPKTLLQNSTYSLRFSVKNEGQSILDSGDEYHIIVEGDSGNIQYFFSDLNQIEPNTSANINFFLKIKNFVGKENLIVNLYKGDEKLVKLFDYPINVKPLPSLTFETRLFPKLTKPEGHDWQIQIFDKANQQLVFKQSDLKVKDGIGKIHEINDIALDRTYRVVLLKPYYLPRQVLMRFNENSNKVVFEAMWPVDFNYDGKLSLEDVWTAITHPRLLKAWLP